MLLDKILMLLDKILMLQLDTNTHLHNLLTLPLNPFLAILEIVEL